MILMPHEFPVFPQLFFFLLFSILAISYVAAVFHLRANGKVWPVYRSFLWLTGLLFAAVSTIGPYAAAGHSDFRSHMLVHLLLGMLSPLLLVIAAPITLLVKVLPVKRARKWSRFMKNRYVSTVGHPAVAFVLNIGGLWLLYRTPLFHNMYESFLIYGLVHLHLLAAGYLFTASIIPFDPMPHRYSFRFRSFILICFLTAHNILAKSLYAYPPFGIPPEQAKAGSILMYYGGGSIELIVIILFCSQWYKAVWPRVASEVHTS